MRWHFYYAKRNAFYPPDYEHPGLGGCESALFLVTRALAQRGHDVVVYNCCYRPGVYDGVTWRMAWEVETAPAPDVAVSVRFSESLWPATTDARQHVFWMLDDRVEGAAAFYRRFGARGGKVVLASHAMRRVLADVGLSTPTTLIPLPVEVDRYRPTERKRACLFSSMPNRGLDVALTIWPAIQAAIPEAELWITSGWQLWGYTDSEANDRWTQLFGDLSLPEGVRRFGVLSRSALVELQQSAWLTLYPSRFPEMFCLVAAESAAAGTPVVTSASYALPERVVNNRTGILIDGSIEEASTQDRFVEATIALLADPARRDRYGRAAATQARRAYAPDVVAEAWEQLLD